MNAFEHYITTAPETHQSHLLELLKAIREAAPLAEETFKYGMPTFVFHGNLVHFASCKNHIGFYPAPSGITNFEKEWKDYTSSKGAIQLPLDQELPLELIKKVVRFRAQENLNKQKAKKGASSVFSALSAPAQRVLESKGIKNLEELSNYTDSEVESWHGIGKKAILILQALLEAQQLEFKKL